MRQPLEEGMVSVGRARQIVRLPADFTLVAAMNPCACGYLGHPHRPCHCPPPVVQRYRARISGPLLDRIDLQVEVPALDPAAFRGPAEADGTSAVLRERVGRAVLRQQQRNRQGHGFVPNGRLQDAALERHAGSDPLVLATLEEVLRLYHLSARARVRLLRIARTLADLEDRPEVRPEDVLEACALRGFAS
jgi:magnesium chelatase family protein